ncbi:MAG: cytochrome c oxidase subunit 3 [Candidatus Kryptonium sp.]
MTQELMLEQEKVVKSPWGGGRSPFGVSRDKFTMWIFILSDAFTFGGLLAAYGALRASLPSWPSRIEIFSAFPFTNAKLPLLFVSIMTFILICSSLTMALAVDAGKRMDRKGVIKYLLLTIGGGLLFLMCQAYEWGHLIHEGARLTSNPWGVPLFSASFFVITGFHGSHVLSGVIVLIVMAIRVAKGIYDKRGSYEGVEVAGLYWHFVDLVWVFIFAFFYLL